MRRLLIPPVSKKKVVAVSLTQSYLHNPSLLSGIVFRSATGSKITSTLTSKTRYLSSQSSSLSVDLISDDIVAVEMCG